MARAKVRRGFWGDVVAHNGILIVIAPTSILTQSRCTLDSIHKRALPHVQSPHRDQKVNGNHAEEVDLVHLGLGFRV